MFGSRYKIILTKSFIISDDFVDGSVDFFSIDQPSNPIMAATLTFHDGGTGIDNIQFTTAPVPEPSTILLIVPGLLGMLMVRKKLKK